MNSHGHRVESLEASGNARVQIGDNYYGTDPIEESRSRMFAWLNPPRSGAPLTTRREPGTNLWFLDTELFAKWHDGDTRFMFLHGIVGCGKTTLLHSIAKKCLDIRQPGELVSAFYFSSTANEGLGLNAFLRFLVAQLCEQRAVPGPLEALYDRHNRSFPPTVASDEELKELVSSLLCMPRTELYKQEPVSGHSIDFVYLLVDGLDEIRDRSVRRDVTGFLAELSSLRTATHSILTTSRPEADILTAIRADCGWRILPIPKHSVRADIEIYVKHELEKHAELADLEDEVRDELFARLAGPEQVMFRWASLQLARLLDAQLLLQPEIFEILSSLPKDLNETYDRILDDISASHHTYASTALRWLTLARRPLLIEELIDACSISFADAGRPSQRRRLRPLDMAKLLPNLISIEPPIATNRNTNYETGIHYAMLTHFSVKEYLLGEEMKARIQQVFRIIPRPCHQFITSCCISYLHWTNDERHRGEYFPLRSHAWDFWAIHCVSSEVNSDDLVEHEAVNVSEKISSTGPRTGHSLLSRASVSSFSDLEDAMSDLSPIVNREKLFDALRRPYFGEEFQSSSGTGIWSSDLQWGHIRLLEIFPSSHWFVPIRGRLTSTSLENAAPYEAVSYFWGATSESRTACINGQPSSIRPNLSQLLRGLRRSHGSRMLWIDAICINQSDMEEKNQQVQQMPKIFASSSQCAIWVGEEDENDTWALDIVDEIDDLLRSGESDTGKLSEVLSNGAGRDPYECLHALFKKPWWGRSWVVQEAVMAPRATLLYGNQSLDLNVLARIVRRSTFVQGVLRPLTLPYSNAASFWQSREWQDAAGLATIVEARSEEGHNLSLSQLVYATRFRKAYQPVDRFYSLFGMLGPDDAYHAGLLVNYASDSADTCVRIFEMCILRERSLDILSYISYREDRVRDFLLPSWASFCAWDADYSHALPLLQLEEHNSRLARFCASSSDAAPTFPRPRIMAIDGWCIDALRTELSHRTHDEVFGEAGYEKFLEHRRIFEATLEHLCLVPSESQASDEVYILQGGKTPYVLRKQVEGWEFVGECLVLGLMHGEHFADGDRSEDRRRITLI